MKYPLTRACGHEEVQELFGPGSERKEKIAWLESSVCLKCHKEEQEEARKRNNAIAGAKNTERKAVQLVGSAGQIDWAESIRDELFVALGEVLASAVPGFRPLTSESKKVWEAVNQHYLSVVDAAWWIENYKPLVEGLKRGARPSTIALLKGFAVHALTTDAEANVIRLSSAFKDAQMLKAKKSAELEKEIKRDSFTARGRALGLKGSAKIWRNEKGDVRIYGDDFAYHAKGLKAGELSNHTSVPDNELISYCNDILAAWKEVKFYF